MIKQVRGTAKQALYYIRERERERERAPVLTGEDVRVVGSVVRLALIVVGLTVQRTAVHPALRLH